MYQNKLASLSRQINRMDGQAIWSPSRQQMHESYEVDTLLMLYLNGSPSELTLSRSNAGVMSSCISSSTISSLLNSYYDLALMCPSAFWAETGMMNKVVGALAFSRKGGMAIHICRSLIPTTDWFASWFDYLFLHEFFLCKNNFVLSTQKLYHPL